MSPHASRVLGFLVLIIVAVWATLSYIGAQAPEDASANGRVVIEHTREGGMNRYSGTVMVPACTTLAAGIRATGVEPTHLYILLELEPLDSCSDGMPSLEEFTLAYDHAGASAPLLKEVTVDGAPAQFSVSEAE